MTPEGQAKILDFGLAKALEGDTAAADISSSPTISHMATQAGIILGTAAYMSPEQAKGKAVDRRADIWAFGCVLYEMLTGKPAFDGETVTDVLAALVRAEPEWSRLLAGTPAKIRSLLGRCLRKDVKQRLQAVGFSRHRQALRRLREDGRKLLRLESLQPRYGFSGQGHECR
jgi:eukaryotic-like serine/threonine-protein kinase